MRERGPQGAPPTPPPPSTARSLRNAVAAPQALVQVSFHIEPYPERSERSVREDLMHIIHRFGQHKALYRLSAADPRPVFYIYDSYQTSASSWANIFSVGGRESIRNTRYDVVALGLWVEEHHGGDLVSALLNATFTLIYFASQQLLVRQRAALMDSTPTLRQTGLCTAPAVPTGRQWLISQRKMACCHQSALALVRVQLRNNFLALCLGVTARFRAGYSDSRVRPWNQRNTKDRRGGQYYRESWSAAAALNPSFISITSWNEWHEGTQIEDCMCVYCVLSPAPSLPLPPEFHPSVFIQARVTCKCAI